MKTPRQPLVAILKTAALELVQEIEIPLDKFPDMIEFETFYEPLPAPAAPGKYISYSGEVVTAAELDPPQIRRFYRFQISDHRAYYKEGTLWRIPIA